MQFNTLLLAASALATLAAAATNTVEFINQDSTSRTVYFTGTNYVPALSVPGNSAANATFTNSWIGNWYSVSAGAENKTGMLGEVTWQGYGGANYFDVSSIVNSDDFEGVKQIFPKDAKTPVSGCQTDSCASQYNKWDDVATLSTFETTLVCLIGNIDSTTTTDTANERRHARDFAAQN